MTTTDQTPDAAGTPIPLGDLPPGATDVNAWAVITYRDGAGRRFTSTSEVGHIDATTMFDAWFDRHDDTPQAQPPKTGRDVPPDRERAPLPLESGILDCYFHSGPERKWQGQVLDEPAPGVYLVELYDWLAGTPDHQRLVRLDDMVSEGWWFYDSAEWMRSAYEATLRYQWEAEAAEEAP